MGDLVAHLGVDNSQFKSGFREAGGTLSSFMSSTKGGLVGLVGGAGAILAPLAGIVAGAWGAAESVSAFKESLAAQRKLSAVIDATGGAAGVTTKEIADFAAEMQTLTNFEDDATTASAAVLAAFTNVRGQTFTDTIESAMDLTAVMGGDLQSNVKLLGKALNDPAEGLAKLSKAGVTFTEQQENEIKALQESGDLLGAQNAILQGVQDHFGGAAIALADPFTQLMNTVGDVAENIGALLLPTIDVLSSAVKDWLGPIAESGDAFKTFGIEAAATLVPIIEGIELAASSLYSTLSPAFEFLFGLVGTGVTTLQEFGVEAVVALSHMGESVSIALDEWTLFFVQVGLDSAHFFTDVIPSYLDWFADNWMSVFSDAASNTLTTFENLGTNIQRGWDAIVGYFTGNPITFDWKPLTDGFISTVKELPNVSARVTTDLEKGLIASIDAGNKHMAESMESQRAKLHEKVASTKDILNARLNPESKTGFGDVEDADASHTKDKKGEKSKASLLGSSDAASVVLRGLTGSSKDKTAEQTLAVNKEQRDLLKENNRLQKAKEKTPVANVTGK